MSQLAKGTPFTAVANVLSAREHREVCPGSLQPPSDGERIGLAL